MMGKVSVKEGVRKGGMVGGMECMHTLTRKRAEMGKGEVDKEPPGHACIHIDTHAHSHTFIHNTYTGDTTTTTTNRNKKPSSFIPKPAPCPDARALPAFVRSLNDGKPFLVDG